MLKTEFETLEKKNPTLGRGDAFNKFACYYKVFKDPNIKQIIGLGYASSGLWREVQALTNDNRVVEFNIFF